MSLFRKTEFMDWDEYKDKIEYLELNASQQNTRRHNVEVMPPVGTTEEE